MKELNSIDDVLESPEAFGWVSFENYKRNRDKYVGRDDDEFALIDRGSTLINNVRRQIYEVEGYRVKSLDEAERVAKNMGYDIRDLEAKPEVIQAGTNGQYDILVRILAKDTRRKREAW